MDSPYPTIFVRGKNLTLQEWLKQGTVSVAYPAQKILLGSQFDTAHRLENGKEYRLAVMRGTKIRNKKKRSIPNLRTKAIHEIGENSVSSLRGEFAFLLAELLDREQLKGMKAWYVAVLHTPIIDNYGNQHILRVSAVPNTDRVEVTTLILKERFHWQDYCAFVFLSSKQDKPSV
jgi:hypothetical protein